MNMVQPVQEKVKSKPNQLRKGLIWGIVGVLVLSASLYIFVSAYTSRSLPKIEGSISLQGLQEEVVVTRDAEGIPHIEAGSLQDLYMAQGYIQAQDRLFQMDLSRRQASGELSEVVGEVAIDRDKYFRTLGLRRAAVASYDMYSDEAKQTLEWFAEGVNLYREQAIEENRLPVEFTLLGYEPNEWTPVDSLVIGKFMAFDLGGHWSNQAFLYWALEHFPEEKALELFPTYPEGAPTILSSYENIEIDIESSLAKAVVPEEFNGSNNWVLSGERSVSGHPLLANDPHLSLGTPSIWYQMHLKAENVNVSGVIFAGIPGIIVGHNDHISWGVTNTGPDVQDLYIEKRNPDNPEQFLYNDEYEQATIHDEPIKVKDGETIEYKVTETRHGPIISEFAHEAGADEVLSLQWTALEPTLELQAVLEMNVAKNWEEFESALENFNAPMQNFVFASTDGTIAYKANGNLPLRKNGDGLLPVPGWTDEYEWTGYVPYDELPRSVNPESGYIATANNKVVDESYPYHISHYWAQPYRYLRIEEVLEEKETYTLDDMKALQMDKKNLHAEEFLNELLQVLDTEKLTNHGQEAIKELKEWNQFDDKDLSAPLIYHQWVESITSLLFQDEIPEDMLELFRGRSMVVDELLRKGQMGQTSVWFDQNGGYEEVVEKAFNLAVSTLEEKYGKTPKEWEWGDAHALYFAHPLSSSSSLLEFVFNRKDPVPLGGSHITVQAARANDEGLVNHGGAWRYANDLADPNSAEHIVGPGQSGHVKSDWYHQNIDDWADGNFYTTRIDQSEGTILTLVPSE
ncbi:beta-lactam antibiotic acylase [Bacillus coahuilensis m2-6]|uniref:penicillin acylase family protein n=1 Tax=Bacillus coahuilensis TaxID=408580 RepID=UPI0001850BB5|nr:beta-lactam antibiotic acylase [Bacillus coahuilensis m2-6]